MLLETGQIKEVGTYRQLKSSSGAFSEFIGKYFQEHKNSEQIDDQETKKKTEKS
jgi:hypothetical protein